LRRHILHIMKRNSNVSFIASSEVLSLLRYPSEIVTLKELFPSGTTFTVVLCLRPADDFLASYKRQLDAQKLAYGARQGLSNYVEKDSWLIDYDSLKLAYETLTDDIRVIDYEKATKSGHNIIETFCRTIGIAEAPSSSALLYLNKRAADYR